MNINFYTTKNRYEVYVCNKDACKKVFLKDDQYVGFTVNGPEYMILTFCESCLKEELENILLELKLKAFK